MSNVPRFRYLEEKKGNPARRVVRSADSRRETCTRVLVPCSWTFVDTRRIARTFAGARRRSQCPQVTRFASLRTWRGSLWSSRTVQGGRMDGRQVVAWSRVRETARGCLESYRGHLEGYRGYLEGYRGVPKVIEGISKVIEGV